MRWRLFGLLVLALTAGCGSLTGSTTETESVTPAPVPTASPTPDSVAGLAPGLSASGITDVRALARNHTQVTTRTSYVLVRTQSTTHTFGNSSVNASGSQRITYENGSRYHLSVDEYEALINGQIRRLDDYEEYRDGSVEYRKWSNDDGLTVELTEPTNGSEKYALVATSDIRRFLDIEDETVSRIDVDGGEYYEVVGTRTSLRRFGPIDSYRARAVIRADGFVRTLDVTFTETRDDERIEAHYNFTYRDVGNAEVTEPEWVPEEAS